jgi:GLPGLI family protein
MKRKVFFLVLLCFFSLLCVAQIPGGIAIDAELHKPIEVIDSADYRFTYSLRCIVDTTHMDDPLIQKLTLIAGKKYSFFHNGERRELPKNAKTDGWSLVASEGLGATFVYKDYQRKIAEVMIAGCGVSYHWAYEESIPAQQWVLCNESRTINGYECHKATTTYMGRDYTAWFTLDIPLHEGPWKFYGLPGLIIEISDSRNHYLFTCIEVVTLKEKEPICRYDWSIKKMKRTDIGKIINRIHNDYKAYLETTKDPGTVLLFFGPTEIPYNPLERE